MQEVIADYEGTVLIVSHDRDFLDRTVTVTLGLDGSGHVDVVAGGYADWERKRAERSAKPAKKDTKTEAATPPPPPPPKSAKLSYKDQRDYELLPDRIAKLDDLIAKGEAALADPDLYTRDPDKFARITASLDLARDEKNAAEMRWLELAEAVEG